MSSYYGNTLPVNLPNVGSQEPFMTQEGKYETAYYGATTGGLGGYGEGDPQHPGFPRFPPFDRIDIRPITNKPGYTTNLSTSPVTGGGYHQTSLGPQYGQQPQNGGQGGQFTGEDSMGQCKVADTGMVVSHSTSPQASSPGQPGMMPHHPYNANNALGGVVNGVQPQNIPIYPWMRPINGGKSFFHSFLHSYSASFATLKSCVCVASPTHSSLSALRCLDVIDPV